LKYFEKVWGKIGGIGDARDSDSNVGSNQCGFDPMVPASLNVPDGDVLQLSAERTNALDQTAWQCRAESLSPFCQRSHISAF